MSGVPSLRERWAPVLAPLPLLAQTQMPSQRGATLGPEIRGKRQAGSWLCIQMPGSLRSAQNPHITEQCRTRQCLACCSPHRNQTLQLLVPQDLANHAYCPPEIPTKSINQPLSVCLRVVREPHSPSPQVYLFMCSSSIILPGFLI